MRPHTTTRQSQSALGGNHCSEHCIYWICLCNYNVLVHALLEYHFLLCPCSGLTAFHLSLSLLASNITDVNSRTALMQSMISEIVLLFHGTISVASMKSSRRATLRSQMVAHIFPTMMCVNHEIVRWS